MNESNKPLLLGGLGSLVAAVLHVAIIVGGPDWYRAFGAGEQMALLAEQGALYPAVLTSGIALILFTWALYACSGAGLIRRLPLLRPVLGFVAAVYLLRGLAGVPAVLLSDHPYLQELAGKMPFMVATSAVCLVLGGCYALGAIRHRPMPQPV